MAKKNDASEFNRSIFNLASREFVLRANINRLVGSRGRGQTTLDFTVTIQLLTLIVTQRIYYSNILYTCNSPAERLTPQAYRRDRWDCNVAHREIRRDDWGDAFDVTVQDWRRNHPLWMGSAPHITTIQIDKEHQRTEKSIPPLLLVHLARIEGVIQGRSDPLRPFTINTEAADRLHCLIHRQLSINYQQLGFI